MAIVERHHHALATEETPSIDLHQIAFRYEPYPMGLAENVISPGYYDDLLANWPPERLFQYKPALGNKYSLSPVNNADNYFAFIQHSEPWLRLFELVRSAEFIDYVFDCLRSYNIDLGYTSDQVSSRFEFSMLSGNGGHIVPHTDAPQKIVTLVIYMTRPGEWLAEYGGGTAALKPKDVRKSYNDLNVNVGFNEVDCLYTIPFTPNACVVFVKTFNSYHAVYPIMGRADLPRKSLTVNIELKDEPRMAYLMKQRPHFRLK